jgi:F-type H+-transporting ATPase subunit b
MAIDWFTIIAQALNFMILVWLMKRFLYKPVLNAIDAREKKINAEIAGADKKKADAKTESDEFKKKNEEFDQQRAKLLDQATEAAQTERQRLLDETRKLAAEQSSKSKVDLKNEESHLREAIIQKIQSETFAISRKALADLAGANLEATMVQTFCRRLSELSEEEKKQLTMRSGDASNSVHVYTSSTLPAVQQTLTENTIKKFFGAETEVKFDLKPELICGIEASASGRQVGWNIAEYLTSLEESFDASEVRGTDHGV